MVKQCIPHMEVRHSETTLSRKRSDGYVPPRRLGISAYLLSISVYQLSQRGKGVKVTDVLAPPLPLL